MPDQIPSPIDPVTGLPQSPTGTPLLPPAVARYVTLAVVLALAVLGSLVALYPESKGLQVGLAISTAVAAVLGIASPGLRRHVGIALLVGATLGGTGCAWWQSQPKLRADLSACATGVVVGEVEALMGEAAKVMQGQPATWDAHLDQLVARGGQAALCAIMALADALAGGTGGTETDPPADYDRATRAAYLRSFARGAALR